MQASDSEAEVLKSLRETENQFWEYNLVEEHCQLSFLNWGYPWSLDQ
jgi:hypothetical protein